MAPIVAIIGRPNVGKSTLFNRLTRTRDALVDDQPGVTRDRHYGNVVWNDRSFILIDTGGLTESDLDDFAAPVRDQISAAVRDADILLLLLDGKDGLLPSDRELFLHLKQLEKPLFVAVNKVDGSEKEGLLADFYALGCEHLFPLSAEHRYGVSDLLDALAARFPTGIAKPDETTAETIRIAVVGRPNVGKSSLINRLLGQERLVVSDVPGTTRDAIDSICETDGRAYQIMDTAGIRKKGKVRRKIEKFSIIKALQSMNRCHIALILFDAVEGITDQDITIAGYALERGCGVLFLINKWDAIEKDHRTTKIYTERVRNAAKFLPFAPIITISAKTGLRVTKIFPAVNAIFKQYTHRIGTGALNRMFEKMVHKNPPALHKGRRVKLFYATQITTAPPTLVAFTNQPEGIHFSYKRYLINQIRKATGLDQTPIRLFFRKRRGYKGRPGGK